MPELESDDGITKLSEQTYAKMQMNVQQDETTILGLFLEQKQGHAWCSVSRERNSMHKERYTSVFSICI